MAEDRGNVSEQLDEDGRALIDATADRLEEAWQTSDDPQLFTMVPVCNEPTRTWVRVELIKIDMWHRWRRGRKKELEEYLVDDWADLVENSDALAELLTAECLSRAVFDTLPDREELDARFPKVSEQVDLDQVELDATEDRDPPPSVPELPPGHCLGRYRIERCLGQGTMARVYLAEDQELPRKVAVKVPHPAADNRWEADRTERLLDETRILAPLKHPAIVPIYDAGKCENGTPYLVTEYVEGTSLKTLIESEPLARSRVAELIAQVAEGLDYAHRHGVYHLDLKPGNVLMEESGRPRVADFGLAVEEKLQRLLEGQCRGTPAYMSPEQVRGKTHHLDGRADIWSLGVMLYEMLAGRRPFQNGDVWQLFDEIEHRDPKPPRMIDDSVPEPLERICLKCLSKAPTDRYQTAADVARELRQYLKATESPVRRLWVSRFAVPLAVTAAILAAGFMYMKTGEGTVVLQLAEPDVKEVDTMGSVDHRPIEIERPQVRVRVPVGKHEVKLWKDGFKNHAQVYPIHIPWRRAEQVLTVPPLPPPLGLLTLEVSPAAANVRIDGTLRSANTSANATTSSLRRFEVAVAMGRHELTVSSPGFEPRAETFTIEHRGQIKSLHVQLTPLDEVGRLKTELEELAAVVQGVPSNDSNDETVSRLREDLLDYRIRCLAHPEAINTARLPIKASQLLSRLPWPSDDLSAETVPPEISERFGLDVPSELVAGWARAARREAGAIWSIIYSADGKYVIATTGDEVTILDAGNARPVQTLRHTRQVFSVAQGSDARTLITAGRGLLKVWDARNWRERQAATAKYSLRRCFAALSSDGRWLALGNQTVELWEIGLDGGLNELELPTINRRPIPRPVRRPIPRPIDGRPVAFSPDSRNLAFVDADGSVAIWQVDARLRSSTPEADEASVRSIAFSADGVLLAWGAESGAVRFWDTEEGRPLPESLSCEGSVQSLVFSPDGSKLAAAGAGIDVWTVDPDGNQPWHALRRLSLPVPVCQIAFGPDSRHLASANSDGTIYIFRFGTAGDLPASPPVPPTNDR